MLPILSLPYQILYLTEFGLSDFLPEQHRQRGFCSGWTSKFIKVGVEI